MRISLLILFTLTCLNAKPCTIFYFAYNGKTFFCNNEDWSNPDTEIRFHPAARGKYAWVYFGFSNDWAQGGVNEKGLCWDWVAGYKNTGWKIDKTKKTINGNLSEKIITECATVDEAIDMFKKYNDDSFSYARTMIADKFGNSAIIGWKNGNMFVQRNKNKLQAFGFKGDVIESYFSEKIKEIGIDNLSTALDLAHQEGKYPTQYSNIISLNEGKIYLYRNHNFSEYVEINYLTKLNNGYSKYKIIDFFDANKSYSEVVLKKRDKTILGK